VSLKDRLKRQLGEPEELLRKRAEARQLAREAAAAEQTERAEPEELPAGEVLRRLRRLHRPTSKPPEPKPTRVFKPFRRTQPDRPVTTPPIVPRVELERAGTACLHGRLELPAGTLHGTLRLDEVLRLDGRSAVLLSGDPDLADFDPTRALFFDLETTGLMGGSGNLAFLSGGMTIDAAGTATLHQLMLRDPTEEPAALDFLAELLKQVDYLVSFNGKSFDRNVLADRFTMNRMEPDRVLEMPHLDLLHPSRRLFRKALRSCSLGALEEGRLGVHRDEAEVRGAEVPGRWFDFLRTGRVHLLEPVVEHNALDLLSLLTLAAHLSACVEAPGASLPEPSALIAASKMLLERGEQERAEEVLKMLTRGVAEDPVVYGALGIYADHLRRVERYEEALALWTRMLEAAGEADLDPWRAAAIALEWRLGRPADALALVDELLERVGEGSDPLMAPEIAELRRRRERLVKKAEG
jgi:uncharacterized protein